MNAPRSRRVEVNGWVVFDKPVGMTSTHAVALLKRLFNAKKAGHAGTLDPLASGLLPIAFGEATKTVPFVQEGEKAYRFTVAMGRRDRQRRQRRNGRRGARTARLPPPKSPPRCPLSPARSCRFHPPFRRSRSMASAPMTSPATARRWNSSPRPVTIRQLQLVAASGDAGGVRGALRQGHLCACARPRSRPRARLLRPCDGAAAHPRRTVRGERCGLVVGAGGDGERALTLAAPAAGRSGAERSRLHRRRPRRGGPAPARPAAAAARPRRALDGMAYAACGGVPVAFGAVEGGELVPSRVFNLPF